MNSMDSDTLARSSYRIKFSHNAEGRLVASRVPAAEPTNDIPVGGTIAASSRLTRASIEFTSRNGRHRDDDGQFIDRRRLVDNARVIDTNHLIDPARTTLALEYVSADPRFTLTEQLKFVVAYRETPAKFDQIASHLPGRTPPECIDHYYRYKFDGRFKDESRHQRYNRLPASRINGQIVPPPRTELEMTGVSDLDIRLRGAPAQEIPEPGPAERWHNSGRSMRRRTGVPNYSEAQDRAQDRAKDLLRLIPLDMHIAELKEALGMPLEAKVLEKTRPSEQEQEIVLPRPFNLDVLSENFQYPFDLKDNELMNWLRSDKVLPLVKECFDALFHSEEFHPQLFKLLQENEYPYHGLITDLAHVAEQHKLWPPCDLNIDYQEILIRLAQFAYRIGQANKEFLRRLYRPDQPSEQKLYIDGAAVLLFALKDIMEDDEDGFFAILSRSPLGGMVKSTVRGDWENFYPFEREDAADGIEYPAPRHREDEEWEAIFEYEGEEGRHKDWDDLQALPDPADMIRADSGMED